MDYHNPKFSRYLKRLFLWEQFDNNTDLSISQPKESKEAHLETNIQKFNEIKDKIEKRELYINPKLNLRSLALELGLKEKELSRLINECEGQLSPIY